MIDYDFKRQKDYRIGGREAALFAAGFFYADWDAAADPMPTIEYQSEERTILAVAQDIDDRNGGEPDEEVSGLFRLAWGTVIAPDLQCPETVAEAGAVLGGLIQEKADNAELSQSRKSIEAPE